MNTLSFIAAVIQALAWPTALTVLALVFRSEVRSLLKTIKRLKGPGVELERDVERLQEKASALPTLPEPKVPDYLRWLPPNRWALVAQIREVAEISPVAAVALAWTNVEAALAQVVDHLLPTDTRLKGRFAVAQAQALRSAGHIDNQVYEIFDGLRGVRNKALHDHSADGAISKDEAIGYGEVAVTLVEYLESLMGGPGSGPNPPAAG